MNKEIGTRIKKIRVSKEIDAKKVADDVGIQTTSLSKIEREGTNSVKTLVKLAKALKVSVTEFFEDSHLVAEPKEKTGFVTREEWLQSNHEIIKTFKTEFAKFREEHKIKKDPYKLKNKSRKPSKKK